MNNFLPQKEDNFIARRIRMTKKASLTNFNYFVTFTYDSALHTEETFRNDFEDLNTDRALGSAVTYI